MFLSLGSETFGQALLCLTHQEDSRAVVGDLEMEWNLFVGDPEMEWNLVVGDPKIEWNLIVGDFETEWNFNPEKN